jgi:single-strand DNA-binding protein
MMNSIQLVGRAGGDCEIKYFENGRNKATFRLAVDRGTKKRGTDEWASDWFTIEIWSNAAQGDYQTLAEKALEKVKKGDVVAVKGALHIDPYEKDGHERQRITVQADWFRVVAKKGEHAHAGSSNGSYGIGHAKAQPPADWNPVDDEIPF